jgi:hypothetical protein
MSIDLRTTRSFSWSHLKTRGNDSRPGPCMDAIQVRRQAGKWDQTYYSPDGCTYIPASLGYCWAVRCPSVKWSSHLGRDRACTAPKEQGERTSAGDVWWRCTCTECMSGRERVTSATATSAAPCLGHGCWYGAEPACCPAHGAVRSTNELDWGWPTRRHGRTLCIYSDRRYGDGSLISFRRPPGQGNLFYLFLLFVFANILRET